MKLLLASRSPRRRQLLDQIGVRFEALPVDIDEHPLPGESPAACAARLATAKAERGLAMAPGRLVLGADTVVARDGRTFGKPRDQRDAIDMLLQLANGEHQVITAVALAGDAGTRSVTSISRVCFGDIDATAAQAYWATGEPADKAGGYGIQGLGAIFVRRIEGSYSGVMGLPLFETATLLIAAGFPLLGSD